MNTVLCVPGDGETDQNVIDVATAVAAVVNATVRTVDLRDIDQSAGRVERVLVELAEPGTVLGVLPGAGSLHGLGWRVVQRTGRPVILVPPTHPSGPQMISRALIPLDSTPESANAVAEMIGLLADAGVDLVVLHVFDATTVPKYWDQPAHAEQAWQAEFLARYCDQPGVRLQLRSGVPGEHVLDVAATEQVDLIALGWSQQLDKGRAQTVRRTLRDSRVPVLVVPIPTPL